MPTTAVLIHILALVAMAASVPATEPKSDTFIAVVKRGANIHSVAKAITRHNDNPDHPWLGSIKKTHPHIGVLLIHGSHDTCKVLSSIPGIKECEKDSIVTIAK